MAKVKWTPGIDVVSGLLGSRPKAGDPHSSHSSVLLATHRTAATENPDCSRLYLVGEYKRSTVPQAKELAARALRFGSSIGQSAQQGPDAASDGHLQLPRTEGHPGWQKDHEGVPLEGLRRCLRRSSRRSLRAVRHGRKRSLRRSLFF